MKRSDLRPDVTYAYARSYSIPREVVIVSPAPVGKDDYSHTYTRRVRTVVGWDGEDVTVPVGSLPNPKGQSVLVREVGDSRERITAVPLTALVSTWEEHLVAEEKAKDDRAARRVRTAHNVEAAKAAEARIFAILGEMPYGMRAELFRDGSASFGKFEFSSVKLMEIVEKAFEEGRKAAEKS